MGTFEDMKILQTFTYADAQCDGRPIRWTHDPSKCLDAIHPTKVLLTDCSGVDSQRFLWKCQRADPLQCKLLTLGGRKDACITGETALRVKSCAEIHSAGGDWEFNREFNFPAPPPGPR